MNTRIQVEHGVTELVTGLDLVKEQLRLAAGEQLCLSQEDIVLRGHALECRINAECPEKNFLPSPGKIAMYDSLAAKIMTYGRDRKEAVAKMEGALAELEITGIQTNKDFQKRLLIEPEFAAGCIDTGFVEEVLARIEN